jgi:hypothetical protein
MSKNSVRPNHQGGRTLANMGRKLSANNPPKKQVRARWAEGNGPKDRRPYEEGGISGCKATLGFTETERERTEREESIRANQSEDIVTG